MDLESSDLTVSKQAPPRVLSKPHSRTANEALGSSGWKAGINNEDQFKIRIHKEGKAYTKKVRIEGQKKPV